MDFGGRSVMVVEDHEFQRRLAVKLLQDLGVREPLEGANGRDALNQLLMRDEPVDLVLCDLDMPEMDGVEFITHVALNKLARALVVVSGMDLAVLHTVETMARAYGMQVLGVIQKPLNHEQLSARLAGFEAGFEGPSGGGKADVTPEELRRGLDRGEFIVFYLPQVALRDGDLLGVEARVRWFRPAQGVLPAGEFIAEIERAGLLDRLAVPLLKQVCEGLRSLDGQGLRLDASMKLNALSLRDAKIADELADVVQGAGCEPARITFEIIETGDPGDQLAALSTLARLRIKGFGLALEDVDEGHPSLDQMVGLPFTELRIDQSMLRDAAVQKWSLAVLEASLGLARKLGLRTVAKRVETQTDWEAAAVYGLDRAQGFFISRPMPVHQLPEWYAAWKAAGKVHGQKT